MENKTETLQTLELDSFYIVDSVMPRFIACYFFFRR